MRGVERGGGNADPAPPGLVPPADALSTTAKRLPRTRPWETAASGRGALPWFSPEPITVDADLVRVDMGEVVAAEIGDGQLAEDVVEDRGGVLDRVVALDEAGRLEAGEGEGVDIFLERHAVLQAERDGDGEVVHQAAEGGAFLVHVDEDLAEAAVVIFAGAQIDLVAADDRLLGVALAAVGQLLAGADGALDDPLDDALGERLGARRGGLGDELGDGLLGVLLLVGEELRVERLRQLRAVAVEGVGLQRQPPGEE